MKVIFLDIDGVLVTSRNPMAVLTHTFEKDKIETLNAIVSATGADIVISSSWRNMFSFGSLKTMFEKNRLKANIIGKTPSDRPCRGDEIAEWLDEHAGVDKFVIIDDDDDMGELMDHLVRTNMEEGITQSDAQKAIAMLS